MNEHIRTDLALELNEDICDDSSDNGIKVNTKSFHNGKIIETIINIINENGEKLLGKPIGSYITIEGDELNDFDEDIHKGFCESLGSNLKNLIGDVNKILVIGLGNRQITPDALGPFVVDNLFITRHLIKEKIIDRTIEISAISPGVLAQTGIETKDILESLCEKIKPDVVIAIDALAAREPNRLGRTIQICDTGISPGSGVGNDRVRLDYETLGVKVIAIGVPTVISVPSIVNQALDGLLEIFLSKPEGKNVLLNDDEKNNLICNLLEDNLISMFVTPKSIDESVKRISFTISEAINSFLEFQ